MKGARSPSRLNDGLSGFNCDQASKQFRQTGEVHRHPPGLVSGEQAWSSMGSMRPVAANAPLMRIRRRDAKRS
jgi:hypothetical protein